MEDKTSLTNFFERINEIKRLSIADSIYSVAEYLFLETCFHLEQATSDVEIEDIFDWSVFRALQCSVLGVWSSEFVETVGEDEFKEISYEIVNNQLLKLPDGVQTHFKEKMEYLWNKFHNVKTELSNNVLFLALCDHDRAGYSKNGSKKVIFFPKESQAEHSYLVFLYSRILTLQIDDTGADISFMSFVHHLLMSIMPDVDHEVEAIVGNENKKDWEKKTLTKILKMNLFSSFISEKIQISFCAIWNESTPANFDIFSESDFLDRVYQAKYFIGLKNIGLKDLIDDYALLNDGEISKLQLEILRSYKLTETDKGKK